MNANAVSDALRAQDVDVMRDVYLTRRQREAFDRMQAAYLASRAAPLGEGDARDAALWRKHKDSFSVLQAMLEAASPLALNKLKAQEAAMSSQERQEAQGAEE